MQENWWKKIPYTDHHGINIPLFSLRTQKNCGIGEYLDLLLLIDWCAQIGFDTIQILPINDSGQETSPYNALSSCALNPVFLSLWALPHLEKFPELQMELNRFIKYKDLQKVPYTSIYNAKMRFLHLYYQKAFPLFQNTEEFYTFQKQHEPWLSGYALFRILKEKNVHQDWSSWDFSLQNPSRSFLKKCMETERIDMHFYEFLQFLCFSQFMCVKAHAQEKGVFLQGDLPILISPESHDVWLDRQNFQMDFSAGSPPDIFTPDGQVWGFPPYQWEAMQKDDFSWWHMRMQVAKELYDIYRIDHIVGFYRIWAVPQGEPVRFGRFIPNDPWVAMMQGETILSKITSASDMLPIGEDLGAGDDVPTLRKSISKLGILGTKVPRWERENLEKEGSDYIPYKDYPRKSLTTISTHDSLSLIQWWEKYPSDAKLFCSFQKIAYKDTLLPEMRMQILKNAHQSNSIFHINLLPEYLSLFPDLVYPDYKDESINTPGTVSTLNWSYRIRPYLEDLIQHEDLFKKMSDLAA